jgi:hypothetical protein
MATTIEGGMSIVVLTRPNLELRSVLQLTLEKDPDEPRFPRRDFAAIEIGSELTIVSSSTAKGKQ